MEIDFNKFRMVDVSKKTEVFREAVASGNIRLKPETIQLIREAKVEKGDPLAAAELASVLAAKNTSQLIPLCHPIPITAVKTNSKIQEDSIEVETKVKTTARTGVEMEALVAATTYLLTIWDMVKKYEKDDEGQYPSTAIESILIKHKSKG